MIYVALCGSVQLCYNHQYKHICCNSREDDGHVACGPLSHNQASHDVGPFFVLCMRRQTLAQSSVPGTLQAKRVPAKKPSAHLTKKRKSPAVVDQVSSGSESEHVNSKRGLPVRPRVV